MGWLYRITINQCKMLIRARSRQPDREFVQDQEPGVIEHSALDSYREGAVYESVREALNSLPEIYSQVVTLRYFGGMTVKEMARFLGVSPNTIDRRLRGARARLKEEMIAMMSTTYQQHELPASFTFRIVEMVKRIKIKINPTPRVAGLPWGLSLAVGIIVAVLNLNSHLTMPGDIALPADMKALKTGEIPVDILKTPQITVISSKQGSDGGGGSGLHDPQNALLMAPHGEGGTWTKKADMPTGRCGLSSSVVEGKIYTIGGRIGNTPVNTVEEYDPATDTWTKKADMPTARMRLSTSVMNGKIYAFGGMKGIKALSAVEEYDPATDTWTKKADMPVPIAAMSTSVFNGRIYVIGGGDFPMSNSTVYEYDPAADTWAEKADIPTERGGLSTAVFEGKIYAFGGFHGEDESTGAVEEYDPATDQWDTRKDMPVSKGLFGIGVVNGRIYLMGGSSSEEGFVSRVDVYDPSKYTWEKGAPMPSARWNLSASEVDGKIYVFGGWDPDMQVLPTVEEYTPEVLPPQEPVSPHGSLPTTWGEAKLGTQMHLPQRLRGR
jgi:N-acetylneuraminic acid mutarotase